MSSPPSTKTYTGGCLCKANRYEITTSSPLGIRVCHCLDCQKATGSAFMANIVLPQSEFRFTQGGTEDVLGSYTCSETLSGNEVIRRFCTKCGSPMYAGGAMSTEMVVIMTGTLDEPTELQPATEQFIKDRRSWLDEVKTEGIVRFNAMGV
ncbi:hypothetical protein CONPUDRAFT_105022 [Coniophora puteana RWD-64-598 SS2]|uniref:CENP-V/GFA domain-containing protein n=1 Tax=Coniophora puteana (strain RWD-64-598) TaxID=741705 RepID=A0A5M3MR03_CONPW|nr:uncharacterized protein CONPUDRAFT_105022 [Coniophora puteana RWD-64-598 SS2]EIW81589.1 hypothetical protein CONPUDRAFT_105022 [Coniophora puteana RWD-64-598 SS2]